MVCWPFPNGCFMTLNYPHHWYPQNSHWIPIKSPKFPIKSQPYGMVLATWTMAISSITSIKSPWNPIKSQLNLKSPVNITIDIPFITLSSNRRSLPHHHRLCPRRRRGEGRYWVKWLRERMMSGSVMWRLVERVAVKNDGFTMFYPSRKEVLPWKMTRVDMV